MVNLNKGNFIFVYPDLIELLAIDTQADIDIKLNSMYTIGTMKYIRMYVCTDHTTYPKH